MTSVVVELFNRKIPIKTQDPKEHIENLVQLIESKAEEIDPNRRLPEMTLAILTLLNLSDDLAKERDRMREIREQLKSRANYLLEKIEHSGYVC
jgi:cell division protein ZapA (FtsZ GTPase activity inhibitor)